jgi:hypothetical protein
MSQMAIAFVVEERNCIQAEVDLASRRCRLLVFAAHNQALQATQLNSRLDTMGDAIAKTVEDVSNKEGVHIYSPSRYIPAFRCVDKVLIKGHDVLRRIRG